MSRERTFLRMLEATSKIQLDISMILEAKAVEAEKIRNWTLNHMNSDAFDTHDKQLHVPLQIHGQIVELIRGLTKLENGICNNMKVVLGEGEAGEDGGDMNSLFGNDFDQGDQ
ncbi:hypothetical protein D3C76_1024560 [compost metagenome]